MISAAVVKNLLNTKLKATELMLLQSLLLAR